MGSSPSEGETTFGDDVYKDDVLAEGGGDDRYGEPSGEESPEDDRVVDLPPTEERREACRKWRTDHAVSPGVSWGTLPADLQRTWRDYDCDIFLQDAVQGMLANEGEHAERRESLDAKAASRLDDDFFDDKGDDDVSATGNACSRLEPRGPHAIDATPFACRLDGVEVDTAASCWPCCTAFGVVPATQSTRKAPGG